MLKLNLSGMSNFCFSISLLFPSSADKGNVRVCYLEEFNLLAKNLVFQLKMKTNLVHFRVDLWFSVKFQFLFSGEKS